MLPVKPAALAQALVGRPVHAAEFQLQSDHKRNAVLRASYQRNGATTTLKNTSAGANKQHHQQRQSRPYQVARKRWDHCLVPPHVDRVVT